MTRHSAIYEGSVRHRRFGPVEHEFDVRMFMMYLDLDEIPGVFSGTPLWSATRKAPARFRRDDFLGDPKIPLKEAVVRRVEEATGRRPRGPVRMLAHLRYFGHIFNPVTFYYVFDPEGGLRHVLAEITNTPWKERHVHVLTVPPGSSPGAHHFHFPKAFHVSPFLGMDMDYDWRFGEPGDRLSVRMQNFQDSRRVFDVSLSLEKRELTPRSLNLALARYPLMTLRVVAGIYTQAARLRVKGATFHPHPSKLGAREAVPTDPAELEELS